MPPGDDRQFAIIGARLFDGVSPRPVMRPFVLVAGGRIVAVDEGAPPSGIDVRDLGDVTLLPGLIDVHQHLGFDAGPSPVERMVADASAELLDRMRANARRALAAGITTVRDLGDREFLGVDLRDRVHAGREVGPGIVAAGPPLTTIGGHGHFLGGACSGPDGVRDAVRAWVRRGVDVIKLMVTGGVLTPGTDPLLPQFTAAELTAAVRNAHELGCPVTAHVHGAAGVRAAVAAGVDGLEHAKFWTADGVHADPSVIDAIAERRIWVCPTLGHLPGGPPLPPPVADRLAKGAEVVALLHRSGVRLVAGTDAGISPAKPHDVLPYALYEIADCGLNNVEVLRSATSLAAQACRRENTGVLAPGRDADILAVDGDALTDLRSLQRVRAVFRAGVQVA